LLGRLVRQEGSVSMPSTPPYPEQFKRDAVALVRSSEKSIPQLADELGVSPQSLRNWVLSGVPDKRHYPELRIIWTAAREPRCRGTRRVLWSG
jgi:transposase